MEEMKEQPAHREPVVAAPHRADRSDFEDRPVHVLLVKKHSSDIRAMLESAEKPLGVRFRWTCIGGPESYPDQLGPNAFDIVLLDLDQPGEDGFLAVHRTRFFAPSLPIVVLASADQKRAVPRGVRHEVQDILVREQLTGILLANSLHHVCERSRLQHALGSLPQDCRTGLYNRSFFMLMADHYLRLAGRLKGLVAMYAELDGIHRINPPLFYLEERRFLLNAARVLAKSFRESDLVAHWGRIDFVALAVGASTEHVPIIAARLKKNLTDYNLQAGTRQQVEISVGFAVSGPTDERSIGELIADAEAARRRGTPVAEAS
ncbi:hypothetical protein AYO40_06925 [Planctomycetaceae bacterium SCGC AG-212-D15]|nr:hypothetical protein AYO40_06925 [Planctomycetaceae bacterium SCGC AG-212-D15]